MQKTYDSPPMGARSSTKQNPVREECNDCAYNGAEKPRCFMRLVPAGYLSQKSR